MDVSGKSGEFHASQGAEAAPDTPAEFTKFIDAELVKYARIVKASGAKVD